MKIVSVLGNNVVSSVNDDNEEIIITGKGIGFKAKKGDEIDPSKITKIYTLNKEDNYTFKELVKQIPESRLSCADDIINYAEETLQTRLSDFIYITLTDHLNYAIERQVEGLIFENQLLWEIKHFYNKEFQIGLKALELIKEKLGVELPEDEAGFIALHIVTAEQGMNMNQTLGIPKTIKDILNIVKYNFNINLEESSLDYQRFLTHLKFFLARAIKGEKGKPEDTEFYEYIINKYPEAYKCVLRIEEYMKKKIDYKMSLEEKMYLTVHIKRIIM